MNNKNWIISCDTKIYDIDKAFNDLGVIDYHQTTNVEVGSYVYIYCIKPVMAIRFKCIAEEVDIHNPNVDSDNNYYLEGKSLSKKYYRYMRLRLVEKYEDERLNFYNLKKHGLTSNLQGPCRISEELQEYIDRIKQ